MLGGKQAVKVYWIFFGNCGLHIKNNLTTFFKLKELTLFAKIQQHYFPLRQASASVCGRTAHCVRNIAASKLHPQSIEMCVQGLYCVHFRIGFSRK